MKNKTFGYETLYVLGNYWNVRNISGIFLLFQSTICSNKRYK